MNISCLCFTGHKSLLGPQGTGGFIITPEFEKHVCSALLTTTMGVMGDVVKAAEAVGVREKIKIMIGGAPVNEEFCREIGADCYTPDAASAADMAVELCKALGQ